MKIKFWGTRGSIPTPEPNAVKYGGDTSCVEVRLGRSLFVCDAGTGVRRLGAQLSKDPDWDGRVHLFLSHTHWDHIQGFPFFAPVFQPGTRMTIYGAFRADFRLDECLEGQMSNLYFPVKMKELPAKIEFVEMIEESIEVEGATVMARALNHPQGCFGYRIDDGHHVVVYATDTEPLADRTNDKLVELAQGADVLIHDAQYTPEEYARGKKGWGHSTWKDAVSVAMEAQVKTLVLFHHDPYHDDDAVDSLVLEARSFFPNTLGASRDLMFTLSVDAEAEGRRQVEARPGVQKTIQLTRDQPIKVSYVEKGTSIIFHIPEDLTLFNSRAFAHALCSTVKSEHRKIVLNMTRLSYLDSAGVGSLASIYSFAKKAGVPLCMTNIASGIKNVLEITRFTQLIPIFKSEDEAVP
jgi:anti-anti-sigma factor